VMVTLLTGVLVFFSTCERHRPKPRRATVEVAGDAVSSSSSSHSGHLLGGDDASVVVGREGRERKRVVATEERPQRLTRDLPPSHDALRLRAKAFPIRELRDLMRREYGVRGWGTCAVVGNSGSALGKGRGALVDSNEVVIRLNMAPTKGHEDDVGRKTQVSFINGWLLSSCIEEVAGGNGTQARRCSCWNKYREGGDVMVVGYAITEGHVGDGQVCSSENPTKFHLFKQNDHFSRFTQSLVNHYTSERIKRNYPQEMWHQLAEERRKVKLHYSSGLQAVVFALTLCSNVSLFGFGKEEAGQHHYFEGKTKGEVPDHDYEAEKLFYNEMEDGSAYLFPVFDVHMSVFD